MPRRRREAADGLGSVCVVEILVKFDGCPRLGPEWPDPDAECDLAGAGEVLPSEAGRFPAGVGSSGFARKLNRPRRGGAPSAASVMAAPAAKIPMDTITSVARALRRISVSYLVNVDYLRVPIIVNRAAANLIDFADWVVFSGCSESIACWRALAS